MGNNLKTMADKAIPSDWVSYIADDPKLSGCKSIATLHKRMSELSMIEKEKDVQRCLN